MTMDYLSFDDVEQLAYTNRRMMHITQRHIPLALDPKMIIDYASIYPTQKEVRQRYFRGSNYLSCYLILNTLTFILFILG